MPCRDAAGTVDSALASIAGQTFGDFEAIVVDDGSADGTVPRIEALARSDSRFRLVRMDAGGIVAALSRGAATARGELIARMDADDVSHPDRLARQVALLDDHPDLAACGTAIRYFPRAALRDGARRYERWINGLIESDDIARDIFVECPIPHPTLMIRRRALEAVGGYRETGWPEDYDLVLRLWAAGMKMAKVPEVLLDWREGPDRLSRTDPRYDEAAFRRCKVHWLIRTHLSGRAGAVIWGAGPTGKAMARELLRNGIRLLAFVDLDPRKIGQSIHGAPVVEPARIEEFRDGFTLAAVGQAGARAEIRQALEAAGWRDGVDFCAVA